MFKYVIYMLRLYNPLKKKLWFHVITCMMINLHRFEIVTGLQADGFLN